MDRIAGGLLGQQSRCHDRFGDFIDGYRQIQKRKPLQENETPLCRIGVSSGCLIEDDLRDAQVEALSLMIPPIMTDLLSSRLKEVTTRPRGQVACDRGFEVDALCHVVAPIISFATASCRAGS